MFNGMSFYLIFHFRESRDYVNRKVEEIIFFFFFIFFVIINSESLKLVINIKIFILRFINCALNYLSWGIN